MITKSFMAPDDMNKAIKSAAQIKGISDSDVIRMALKIGLPSIMQTQRVK